MSCWLTPQQARDNPEWTYMYIMNTELARDIVDRTMKIIPFNVNVMDANGSILVVSQ